MPTLPDVLGCRAARASAGLLLLVGLSACSGSSAQKAAPPTPALASPSPTATDTTTPTAPSAPASPSPTPSARPATSSAPGGPPACTSGQLTLTVADSQGAAGTQYQQLLLRNHGSLCTIQGYPGVSMLGSNGRQIGSPAERSPGSTAAVRMAPGATAHALLSIANAGAFPASACQPAQAASVRLFPPSDTVALVAADALAVCSAPGSGQLHISPVSPGSG